MTSEGAGVKSSRGLDAIDQCLGQGSEEGAISIRPGFLHGPVGIERAADARTGALGKLFDEAWVVLCLGEEADRRACGHALAQLGKPGGTGSGGIAEGDGAENFKSVTRSEIAIGIVIDDDGLALERRQGGGKLGVEGGDRAAGGGGIGGIGCRIGRVDATQFGSDCRQPKLCIGRVEPRVRIQSRMAVVVIMAVVVMFDGFGCFVPMIVPMIVIVIVIVTVVMIVVMRRFGRLSVAMVMVRMCAVFGKLAGFGAGNGQQGKPVRSFAKTGECAVEPRGKFGTDPHDEIRLGKTGGLRGAELEIMFGGAAFQQKRGRANFAHHLGDEGMHGMNVRNHARRFCQGGDGGSEGGKGGRYDITHQRGPFL